MTQRRLAFTATSVGVFVMAATLAAGPARATPVTIATPFMNLENRAVNSLGFSTGQFLRIGANTVLPNGDAGTTGTATSISPVTGAPLTTTVAPDESPATPNFFAHYFTDSASVRGPWTLVFTNGANTASTTVTLPAGATQAPFVNTITLSGDSLTPTFTWAPPPGTTVNGYRVNIYDKNLINLNPAPGQLSNNGQIGSVNLAPTITSYTVSAANLVAGYTFQTNHNYSIEISLIQTKDGTSTNLANDNLKAIARVYADFRPTSGGGPVVNLPVTLDNGSYKYNIAVDVGKTYYLDPSVAVGYDFATGAGDPNFKSVVLPTGIGDGLYDIYGFDGSGQTVLLAHDWLGGAVFGFNGLGVSAFRIGGIETAAGLDPTSATAFITGVTFEAAGLFTGTQTPLTVDVAAVPEPGSWLLLLAGFGVAGVAVRARRGDRRQTAATVHA